MAEYSLFETIREGGYEASLIASYNAYFPFYENVVLSRLRAAGCRHNVVLADARQCAAAMADSFSSPRCAGRAYTLIPFRSSAAFHPKILLLVGRSKAAALIGSHNLTVAGFGFNRELTNLVIAKPNSDPRSLSFVRSVWSGLKDWLASQMSVLPRATIDAAISIKS